MQLDHPQEQPSASFAQHIPARFEALIWSLVDAELIKSAVFYAERYFSLDRESHDARHIYAMTLYRSGQIHSALGLVNIQTTSCSGCAEMKAKCCAALGRHRQACEALEDSLADSANSSYASTSSRYTSLHPDEAVLRCRAGQAALRGNLPIKAAENFRHALDLNPMLWEAFEGLCAVGQCPEIDDLFPARPPPTKQGPSDEGLPSPPIAGHGPMATGTGFFTPDAGHAFRGWNLDQNPPQVVRLGMGMPLRQRDSLATNDSSFQHLDNSMIQSHLANRENIPQPSLIPRPLSSAEEVGPAPKKARSTSRRPTDAPRKLATVDTRIKQPPKKARGESVNLISNMGTRRSTRLLSGSQTHAVKHPPLRKRGAAHLRSKSNESEMDEDSNLFGEPAFSPSPSSLAQSPRSEGSPTPGIWTTAQEQAAQDNLDTALADNYIYDLMRLFASAARALSIYDCETCLGELNRMPKVYQCSAWVMAAAGRAHYEMVDYQKAEKAFQAVRNLEPFRLWDMEVYSTLLWHLQKGVQLSFLAQELLDIDARSPQAWIAVGNAFSLQKERSRALTCFRRAAQLDPSCAYAYTLSGHESIDEDLEKAITFFQSALRADPRHYNAWYGLGTCYFRMSKIRLAEYHYRRAVEIHPNNAVLLGCVGMAVERGGDREGAFSLFDEAVRLAPDNVLVRYRRAKLLIAMRRYRAAADDLTRLREATPEEANVVFQLARVYRLMGDEVKAAQLLAVARDIAPKSLAKIKRLVETGRDEGDDMEEG